MIAEPKGILYKIKYFRKFSENASKRNLTTGTTPNFLLVFRLHIGIFLNYVVKIIVFCIIFATGLWSLAGNAWSVLRGSGGVYNVPRTRWWCLAALRPPTRVLRPREQLVRPQHPPQIGPKSMKSNENQWKSLKYHWFSLISNDFTRFSLIFDDIGKLLSGLQGARPRRLMPKHMPQHAPSVVPSH